MRNLSISVKYFFPIFILIVALVITSFLNRSINNSLVSSSETFTTEFLPAINVIVNADRDLYQARVAELEIAFTDLEFRQYMKLHSGVNSSLDQYMKKYDLWLREAKDVIALKEAGETQLAIEKMNSSSLSTFNDLRNEYDQAGEAAFKEAIRLKDELSARNKRNKAAVLIFSLIIVLVTVTAAIISQKALTSRVGQITNRIREITSGGGDLTSKIHVKQRDEIGDLGTAFNEFTELIKSMVSGIRSDGSRLNNTSQSLLETANQSNTILNNQSETSEQIVSAVYEMSQATKEVSNIAQLTAEENTKALAEIDSGVLKIKESVVCIQTLHETINNAADSSKKLSEQSNSISSVLLVIQGVAEQTNLLALNAAIEAARAGEQGRGFAVVADEVRTLALKTQESTESIHSMIENIQSGVENVVNQIQNGVGEVNNAVDLSVDTQGKLNSVMEVVQKVNEMSIQTATATEQQSVVSEDINKNLHSFNEQIKLSKDGADQTKSVSVQISEMSNDLQTAISQFKT